MTSVEFRFGDVEEDGVTLLTSVEFALYVDGSAVWPARGADNIMLEVQADDLLSHLTEYWKPLLLRQTYPFTLNPARPADLRAEARRRWADAPFTQVALEDEALERFQDCHDLARAFAGYFDLPPLWFLRAGEKVLIDTGDKIEHAPFETAVAALSAAGDWIAERLSSNDDRWSLLVDAWRKRDDGNEIELLSWSTSLDSTLVEHFVARGFLKVPKNVSEAANDDDELRLAARMASALPNDQIGAILERVRRFSRTDAAALTQLSSKAKSFLEENLREVRPYEQGEAIARLIRDELAATSASEFDIFGVFEQLGIPVEAEHLGFAGLDALAVWGPRHGPSVLINSASLHHRNSNAANRKRSGQYRVTLAHEFCHLLLDSGSALSAVDVLNSKMPPHVEQRARAFAAALLLPSDTAHSFWVNADRPRHRNGLDALIGRLCRRFTITRSVAAWKLEHGARMEDVHLSPMLNLLVPQR